MMKSLHMKLPIHYFSRTSVMPTPSWKVTFCDNALVFCAEKIEISIEFFVVYWFAMLALAFSQFNRSYRYMMRQVIRERIKKCQYAPLI